MTPKDLNLPENRARKIKERQQSGSAVRDLLFSAGVEIEFKRPVRQKIETHQNKIRKQLRLLQAENKKQKARLERKQLQHEKSLCKQKENAFGHVKSRYAEERTICTVSTASSVSETSKASFHSEFGSIPRYILQRRIHEHNLKSDEIRAKGT